MEESNSPITRTIGEGDEHRRHQKTKEKVGVTKFRFFIQSGNVDKYCAYTISG
jgi:hypothetical protein